MLPLFAMLALASAGATAVPQAELPPGGGTILPTSVSLGEVDPNGKIPTKNGVPGAGTKNWDVALPRGVLKVGHDYVLTVSAQDVGYTGACFAEAIMSQVEGGRKMILQLVDISFVKCEPGHIYVGSKDFGAIPDHPGLVTLEYSMHFTGHHKTTIKVPMLIR